MHRTAVQAQSLQPESFLWLKTLKTVGTWSMKQRGNQFVSVKVNQFGQGTFELGELAELR